MTAIEPMEVDSPGITSVHKQVEGKSYIHMPHTNWPNPEGKYALVLGGTTFMGRSLVNRLLNLAFNVVVINRGRKYWATRDPSMGRVMRIEADRRKTDIYAERIDEVTKMIGKEWDLVADFCGFEGKDVKCSLAGLNGRFKLYSFISSDSVYEVCEIPEGVSQITEEMSRRPSDPEEARRLHKKDDYGGGKLECEEVLDAAVKEFQASGRQPPCIVALRLPDVIGAYDDTHRLFAYYWWIVLCLDEGFAPLAIAESDVNVPIGVVCADDVAATIAGFASASPPKPGFYAIQIGCHEQLPLDHFLAQFANAIARRWPFASIPGQFQCVVQPSARTFLPSVERKLPLNFAKASSICFKPTSLENVLLHCAEFYDFAMKHHPTESFEAISKLPRNLRHRVLRRHWVLPQKGSTPSADDMSDSHSSSSDSD